MFTQKRILLAVLLIWLVLGALPLRNMSPFNLNFNLYSIFWLLVLGYFAFGLYKVSKSITKKRTGFIYTGRPSVIIGTFVGGLVAGLLYVVGYIDENRLKLGLYGILVGWIVLLIYEVYNAPSFYEEASSDVFVGDWQGVVPTYSIPSENIEKPIVVNAPKLIEDGVTSTVEKSYIDDSMSIDRLREITENQSKDSSETVKPKRKPSKPRTKKPTPDSK